MPRLCLALVVSHVERIWNTGVMLVIELQSGGPSVCSHGRSVTHQAGPRDPEMEAGLVSRTASRGQGQSQLCTVAVQPGTGVYNE